MLGFGYAVGGMISQEVTATIDNGIGGLAMPIKVPAEEEGEAIEISVDIDVMVVGQGMVFAPRGAQHKRSELRDFHAEFLQIAPKSLRFRLRIRQVKRGRELQFSVGCSKVRWHVSESALY